MREKGGQGGHVPAGAIFPAMLVSMNLDLEAIAQGVAILLAAVSAGAVAGSRMASRLPPSPPPSLQDRPLVQYIEQLAAALASIQHNQARNETVLDHAVSTLSAMQASIERADRERGQALARLGEQLATVAQNQREIAVHVIELRTRTVAGTYLTPRHSGSG